MWNREAAIFAAYASIVVYLPTAALSVLMGRSDSPSNIDPILMLPMTLVVVFITASIYLNKNRLMRESHGAALGAFSAFAVYCATVLCMMAVFYSSVQGASDLIACVRCIDLIQSHMGGHHAPADIFECRL